MDQRYSFEIWHNVIDFPDTTGIFDLFEDKFKHLFIYFAEEKFQSLLQELNMDFTSFNFNLWFLKNHHNFITSEDICYKIFLQKELNVLQSFLHPPT